MKFIWTGEKWVNGDMIRDVQIVEETIRANKEEWKKKGYSTGNTVEADIYRVKVFTVKITMDDGEWEEYDPLLKWKTRGEAEDTAIKLIQELEGGYSEKCEEETKKTHEEARIEELELPLRVFHIFRRRGMLKVGDILEIIREGKLKEIRGIGNTTEQEILEKVHLFMEAGQ